MLATLWDVLATLWDVLAITTTKGLAIARGYYNTNTQLINNNSILLVAIQAL